MSVRALFPALLVLSSTLSAQTSPATLPPSPPPPATLASGPLAEAIASLLQQPPAAQAHWGISVTELDGTPIFSLDDNKLFRPASTAKLFTTAAAMALLGPDHRFTTALYGDLDTTGTVQGDLTLRGGGDPSFGTDDLPYHREHAASHAAAATTSALDLLAAQLATAGVKQVTGNLLADDSLFERPTPPEGWAAEDLPWGYGALPSALSLGDNQLRLTLTPASSQRPTNPQSPGNTNLTGANLVIDQPVPWLNVTNDVRTVTSSTQGIDAQPTSASPQGIRLYGTLAPSSPPVQETLALNDPAAYAAQALQAVLLQHNITLRGTAVPLHAPLPQVSEPFLKTLEQTGCEATLWNKTALCSLNCLSAPRSTHLLAQHQSPPLAQDIAFTLKTSANLHAELLLHHLGLLAACPSGVTTLGGARVLHQWLQHIGMQPGDIFLYDGSGLSTKDLVTPRSETALLAFAAAQPWFAPWFAALPVGGVDGTLSARFTDPTLKAHVFAKTGTLGETRALAGYLDAASGKRLIFAILVDNHTPGTSADRGTMDAIVAAIAQFD